MRPNRLVAFIHVEKTAGETMKWIMRSSFGIAHCDIVPRPPTRTFIPLLPDELAWTRRVYPWLRSIAGHRVTPFTGLEAAPGGMEYFTFLRDPLQQCASYFQYLIAERGNNFEFEEWIHRDWPRNLQTKRLCGQADAQKAINMIRAKDIFVGLTECFDESLMLLKAIRVPGLQTGYSRRNAAAGNILAGRLLADSGTRGLIREAVNEDLTLYAWVKRCLLPEYRDLAARKVRTMMPQTDDHVARDFRRMNVLANRAYRNLVYKPMVRLQNSGFNVLG